MKKRINRQLITDLVLGKLSPEESLRLLEEIEEDPSASEKLELVSGVLRFADVHGKEVFEVSKDTSSSGVHASRTVAERLGGYLHVGRPAYAARALVVACVLVLGLVALSHISRDRYHTLAQIEGIGFESKVRGPGEENLAAGYYPIQVSPDGRHLLIQVLNESRSQLATIDLHEKQRPIPVTFLGIAGGTFPRDHNSVCFSPDGKWIAYESSESGTNAIYVSPFGGQSGKWQVSPGAAMNPMWAKGKIFYWSTPLNHNEWVDVKTTSGTPIISVPQQVFPTGKAQNNLLYGSSADGTRYLALRRLNSGSGSSLYVVVNWQGLLNPQ